MVTQQHRTRASATRGLSSHVRQSERNQGISRWLALAVLMGSLVALAMVQFAGYLQTREDGLLLDEKFLAENDLLQLFDPTKPEEFMARMSQMEPDQFFAIEPVDASQIWN